MLSAVQQPLEQLSRILRFPILRLIDYFTKIRRKKNEKKRKKEKMKANKTKQKGEIVGRRTSIQPSPNFLHRDRIRVITVPSILRFILQHISSPIAQTRSQSTEVSPTRQNRI